LSTIRPLLVWEVPHYPAYYFDPDDVLAELVENGSAAHSPSRGDADLLTVKTKTRKAPGAALRYDSPPLREIEGLIRLDWDAMDAWFEEDEQVFTHPHDPYIRRGTDLRQLAKVVVWCRTFSVGFGAAPLRGT
jgi:hypothetical protein